MVRLQSLGLFHVWTSGENANKGVTASDFGLERIHSASHMDVNTHAYTHTHTHTGSGPRGTFKPYSLISYLVTVSIALDVHWEYLRSFAPELWPGHPKILLMHSLSWESWRSTGVGMYRGWGCNGKEKSFVVKLVQILAAEFFLKKGFLNLICIGV